MNTTAAHKHLFYQEMAKLLTAGFGIREAAAILVGTKLPRPQAALLKDLNQGLEAGSSIAAAFSKDTSVISDLERTMIDAGERGGRLAMAFQHLADYFGMIARARREALAGIVYPAIMLHLGIFISIVPIAMMQEKFSGVRIFGQLVLTLLCTYAVILAGFLLIRWVLLHAATQPKLEAFLKRIPLLGKARENLAMARFCKVYHACLLAGISMKETITTAAAAAQNGAIGAAAKALQTTVQQGNSLGPIFIAEAAFPANFSRSYATGEQAGTLDHDLAHWADLYQTEAATSIKTLAVMIPKLLYFLILAFVGWRIVAFFSGYYNGILEQLG